MPILETVAMRTVWGAARDFIKAIPREVWYIALAIGLLVWIDGRAYDRGAQSRDAEVTSLETRLQVSNASIDALQAALSDYVEQGRLTRQEAREASQEALEAGQAALDAAQDESRTDWRGVEGL